MNRSVCIDASLVLDWLLAEEQNSRVSNLINIWNKDKYEIVSAPLFYAEVTSVLREKVYFRKINPERGEQAFLLSQTIKIRCYRDTKIQMKAWELAKILNLPRAYDMQYLAVAELEDCELWTADRKLVNSLKGKNERVRWVGEST